MCPLIAWKSSLIKEFGYNESTEIDMSIRKQVEETEVQAEVTERRMTGPQI